ncbi:MAG: hypothetical protein F6K24_48105 [Okeania sp. SIO2D1]|nr:hypothetical protein [Okeania sp. SIO2D1]
MPSITPVIPIPTILLQSLLLMCAIALEATVLRNQLLMSKKTSIEYSIAMNLFSAAFGWMAFLYLQGVMPEKFQLQLIDLVLFGQFPINAYQQGNFEQLLIFAGIISFFVVCAIEYKVIDLLQAMLEPPLGSGSDLVDKSDQPPPALVKANKTKMASKRIDTRKLTTVFWANLFSTTVLITIMMFSSLY